MLFRSPSERKAYIVTGPTSGIGRRTAFELAKHGTVVLVGRDRQKLDEVQRSIKQKGQHAVSVVCDLSDPASVARAAAEIIALHLPIAGLLNNAGIGGQTRPTKNALGWELLVPLLMPFMKFLSTPKRAARVITKVLINASGQTGIYYDEGGHPMLGSELVRNPEFQDRVVAETRAFLLTIPT